MRERKGEFNQVIDYRYDEEMDNWIMQNSDFETVYDANRNLLEKSIRDYELPWNDDYYPF